MSPWEWFALGIGAASMGFAKTGIAPVGTLAVVIFALVLPARESTGILLPLLIVGDCLAVAVYRRHGDWPTILSLLPWIGAGLGLGLAFLAWAGDVEVRRAIGVMILAGVAVALWQRRRGEEEAVTPAGPRPAHKGVAAGVGMAAGFATMVANAAGPLMVLYLLLRGMEVKRFVGTIAWLFLIVNVAKLPFSAGLGLIDGDALLLDLALVPAIAAGAALGAWAIRHIPRHVFEWAALVLAALSSIPLLR